MGYTRAYSRRSLGDEADDIVARQDACEASGEKMFVDTTPNASYQTYQCITKAEFDRMFPKTPPKSKPMPVAVPIMIAIAGTLALVFFSGGRR